MKTLIIVGITVTEAEKGYAYQHLITQNIANGASKIVKPHPR